MTDLSDQVGSGSPAQREKPNFDAFAAGGRVSAAGAGKAEGSLVRPAAAAGWSRSKGSSRRRRPSGNQVEMLPAGQLLPNFFHTLSVRSPQAQMWAQGRDRRAAKGARIAKKARIASLALGGRK